MTQARLDFIQRQDNKNTEPQNATEFLTWYHPDDIHRIAYLIYQAQPKSTQDLIHAPIMILGSEGHTFAEKMAYCRHVLKQSTQSILPFVIAPEIGAAHFMSGFIRLNKTKNNYEIFLFNPTGYTKELCEKRLQIADMNDVSGMTLHISSQKVQTKEKDHVKGEAVLVSCGPISLMYLEYLLKNPQYGLELNEKFILPDTLTNLIEVDKKQYQETICLQRKAHCELLDTLKDDHFEEVNELNYQHVQNFLDGGWKSKQNQEYLEGSLEGQENTWDESSYNDWYPEDLIDYQEMTLTEIYSKENTIPQEKNTESNGNQSVSKEVIKEKIEYTIELDRDKFNALLIQLKKKTQELIDKGAQKNSNYYKARIAAEILIKNLEQASTQFFENEHSVDAFKTFKYNCTQAIVHAKKEFKNHRGWHALDPILKGFFGVLAILTLGIPALIVQRTAKQGYVGTFFNSPKTDSLEKIEQFESDCENYFDENLTLKAK